MPDAGSDPLAVDPEMVAGTLPIFEQMCRYFDAELRCFDRVPDPPFLLVGNHSGGVTSIDVVPFWAEWIRTHGVDPPLYVMVHDLFFRAPFLNNPMRRLGAVPADPCVTNLALESGAPVAVLPGGEYEMFRPRRDRYRVDFAGHKGFVRTALRSGVPVVPMTTHGAHESTFVLTRGEWLARLTRLDRFRIRMLPITWNIPFGPGPGVPTIPIPAKITVEVGEPLDWSDLDADAADDSKVVDRLYDETIATLQATMDRLVSETPNPIRRRFGL